MLQDFPSFEEFFCCLHPDSKSHLWAFILLFQCYKLQKKTKGNLIFQSYTEPSSMHNGVFVNPQNRKPRPQHERGRGNKRRDKEKSELRRQPSKRSYNNNAYQHPMDDYSDLTRSSIRVRICTSVMTVAEFHSAAIGTHFY